MGHNICAQRIDPDTSSRDGRTGRYGRLAIRMLPAQASPRSGGYVRAGCRPDAVAERDRNADPPSSLPNIRVWHSGCPCMARARRCPGSGRSSGRRALPSRQRVFPARGGNTCLRGLATRPLWVRPAHLGRYRSFRRIVSKVIKEYRRYAKDERVRIVSHAKTAGIPAEFPVVSVDQMRDGPDQRPLPHVPCEVR